MIGGTDVRIDDTDNRGKNTFDYHWILFPRNQQYTLPTGVVLFFYRDRGRLDPGTARGDLYGGRL